MNRLGIKVVISYVIITVITTAMFGLIIQSFIINNIINEKSASVKNMSKLTANTIKYLIEKEVGNSTIKAGNVGFKVSKEGYIDIIIYKKTVSVPIEKTEEADIYIMDANNNIVYSSSGTGKTKNELINNSNIFYHIEEIHIKDNLICSILTIAKEEYYTNLNNYINNEIYFGFLLALLFSLIIALVFERKIIGPITVIRKNISNISLEGELNWNKIKTNDELEDINYELYEITKELRSSNKLQKEFFQNTSHELKTPLMSIRGYAEAIKDGVLEHDEEQNALDIIVDESKKLSETITSVLYLGRIEKYTRKSEVEEKINLYREIEDFVELKATMITEKDISIINNIPQNMFVFADKEKVHRIISNLFSNAIRYANTKIVADSYIKNNKVHFLIMDDGRGFINKENEKIFERFYKGDGGNSGLGLSIVSTIVKNFGGEIRAYNSHIGGAAIEIIIGMSDKIVFME